MGSISATWDGDSLRTSEDNIPETKIAPSELRVTLDLGLKMRFPPTVRTFERVRLAWGSRVTLPVTDTLESHTTAMHHRKQNDL